MSSQCGRAHTLAPPVRFIRDILHHLTIIIIFIFVTITFYDHPHKDRLAHWTEQHNKFRGRGGNMVMTTTLQGGNTKERRRKNPRACFMDPLFDWHLIADFSCNVSE